jgi:hypothetical protein
MIGERAKAGWTGRAAACLLAALLLALPATSWAQGQGGTNTTTTVSTSSSTTFNDRFQTERVDTFLTRITARLDGGATVYDQNFNAAFADAVVQAAIAAAQAALNAAVDPDPTIVGPSLIGSSTNLVNSSTATIDTPAGSTQTVTLEVAIGPQTILIGDRDTGGTPFLVTAGTTNFNFNTHTEFLFDRLLLTTNTFLTSQSYELVGFRQDVVASVPEPGSLALLGAALAGLACARRRTGHAPPG